MTEERRSEDVLKEDEVWAGMAFTYLGLKEEGEESIDWMEDRVESLPPPCLDESRVLLSRFLPESKSSIRLIRLFLSCLRLGLLLLVLDMSSLI